MKITKKQLKRIIREEKKMLTEANPVGQVEEDARMAMEDLIGTYYDNELDLSGSNVQDAIAFAADDFMGFVDRFVQNWKKTQKEDPYGPGGYE